jgi:hypothetical protein
MVTWITAVDENGYTLRLASEPPVYLGYEKGCDLDAYGWPWTKTDNPDCSKNNGPTFPCMIMNRVGRTCGQGLWTCATRRTKTNRAYNSGRDSCRYSEPTLSTPGRGNIFSVLYMQTGNGIPTTAYTTHTAGLFPCGEGGRGVRLATHHASSVEIKNACSCTPSRNLLTTRCVNEHEDDHTLLQNALFDLSTLWCILYPQLADRNDNSVLESPKIVSRGANVVQ